MDASRQWLRSWRRYDSGGSSGSFFKPPVEQAAPSSRQRSRPWGVSGAPLTCHQRTCGIFSTSLLIPGALLRSGASRFSARGAARKFPPLWRRRAVSSFAMFCLAAAERGSLSQQPGRRAASHPKPWLSGRPGARSCGIAGRLVRGGRGRQAGGRLVCSARLAACTRHFDKCGNGVTCKYKTHTHTLLTHTHAMPAFLEARDATPGPSIHTRHALNTSLAHQIEFTPPLARLPGLAGPRAACHETWHRARAAIRHAKARAPPGPLARALA